MLDTLFATPMRLFACFVSVVIILVCFGLALWYHDEIYLLYAIPPLVSAWASALALE